MASNTGERIQFIRKLRGMTQKRLGVAVGFSEKTSDIRIAQYETGSRTPKAELADNIAAALEVSPAALDVPNITTPNNVMHTLFALEDLYGFQIDTSQGNSEGEVGKIVLELSENVDNMELRDAFVKWANERLMLLNNDISQEEYNNWRYNLRL